MKNKTKKQQEKCLMDEEMLMFYDEIDCRDLFEGNDEREKIMIFEIGS